MSLLSRFIAQVATLVEALGLPAGQATLYAWILIYLFVSALLVIFLFLFFVRRYPRRVKRVPPTSDLES